MYLFIERESFFFLVQTVRQHRVTYFGVLGFVVFILTEKTVKSGSIIDSFLLKGTLCRNFSHLVVK